MSALLGQARPSVILTLAPNHHVGEIKGLSRFCSPFLTASTHFCLISPKSESSGFWLLDCRFKFSPLNFRLGLVLFRQLAYKDAEKWESRGPPGNQEETAVVLSSRLGCSSQSTPANIPFPWPSLPSFSWISKWLTEASLPQRDLGNVAFNPQTFQLGRWNKDWWKLPFEGRDLNSFKAH